MSFAQTAAAGSIRLESNRILHATCKDIAGNWVESSINLDDHIGNVDGNFSWGSAAYSKTAREIKLDISRPVTMVVLSAQLQKADGSYIRSLIDLNERIWNNNGGLTY